MIGQSGSVLANKFLNSLAEITEVEDSKVAGKTNFFCFTALFRIIVSAPQTLTDVSKVYVTSPGVEA